MSRKPPLGVKILSAVAAITALLLILSVTVMASVFGLNGFIASMLDLGGAVLVLLLGVFYFAYAVGLWKLEPWAWWLAVITNLGSMLTALMSRTAAVAVISLVILVYLFVKRDLFAVNL